MKFNCHFENDQQISSDRITVTAETPKEVKEVFHHCRLDRTTDDILKLANAIRAGSYEHTEISKKRQWFKVDVCLDSRSLDPYRKLLQWMTGYDGNLPDMDLTARHPNRLGYTLITDSCEIVNGQFHAHVFIQAEAWNGQPAEVRAERLAEDYTQAEIGKRKHEREYITGRNGQIIHNPDYLKHHKAEAGLGAPWLWSAIFAWWRQNHASDVQRELLAALDAMPKSISDHDYDIRKGGGDEATLVGWNMYVLDPNGKIDWDGKGTKASCYTWEQFAALAKVPAQ